MFDITIYYLEMFTPVKCEVQAPRTGIVVRHLPTPDVSYYRSLYNAVGEQFNWKSRERMSDDTLIAIIHDPKVEFYVLSVGEMPAGFAEFDRRQPGEVEIVQFGLMPDFIGIGLGKWFLQWAVDKAWTYQPKRVWLHTCTLDHVAALPNYINAGFVQYHQETVRGGY